MLRHRILTALVALIALGVVAAVVYLEQSTTSSAVSTTTTSTVAPTTLPATTVATTTTVTPTTVAPTTVPPTTVPPTTLPPTTLPPTTLPPPDRALVPVVVSSGPSDGQRIAPGAFLLGSVGWADVRPLNGSTALVETTIFFVDGMQAAAELMALDAALPLTSIAPMRDAPPVAGLADAQLLFYFGGA
jgi:hypothetical protein